MLFAYLQQCQRLLNDQENQQYNIFDLTEYVNRARQRIAAAGQCVRYLPPSSGSFATLTVGSGGTGYTTPPTVTISAPDAYGVGFTQATATATVGGGNVTGFTITNAGTGYVSPTVTIAGGNGTGAVGNFTLTPFLSTVANQEVYTFSTANALFPASTGIDKVIAIQTVAVAWGSQKPVLRRLDWSGFQAYLRSMNLQAVDWPSVWAQYAQGVAGSIYLFPIPSQTLQMEWDCYCLPKYLANDQDVEALPYPWTDAVPYYACYLASISASNADRANFFFGQYKGRLAEARSWVTTAIVSDFYEGL